MISRTTSSSFENVKNFLYAEDAENKIRDLLHAIDESSIVAFTDLGGIINHVNDKFCEISGYTREELIGSSHRIVNSAYHSKEFFSCLWQTISKGKIWKGEIKNRKKDGTFYWVFMTIIPILNTKGAPREYLSIRYDITDKKKLEEDHARIEREILESRINQEASERFVSSLTHDLRTPLTTIRLATQLIARGCSKDRFDKQITKIFQNLNRTEEMVNDLLNSTKIRAGQKIAVTLEKCNASEIAKKTIEELITIHGPRFELVTAGDGIGIWSPSGIKRLIENLCINAIKYGDETRPITVSLSTDEKMLELRVQNWGNTLREEERSNLFDYLQRTNSAQKSQKNGWGIGLTIVKGIAESHGGSVSVTSDDENGTIFKIILPSEIVQ